MIVYACADLIFATKVGSTAQQLGLPARPTRDAAALQRRLDRVDDGKLNQPVTAAIVDLDKGEEAIALIEQIKRHDGAIPVVAFGPHVAVELLRKAAERGADHVMTRGAFSNSLPDVLRRLAGGE